MKETLDIIKKAVRILDSVSYPDYSDGTAKTYLEYMKDYRADEDKLIAPILLRKFLEEVLSFELGRTITTQETKVVGKPDYVPIDTRTHPFVFDSKGTDTKDLSCHYPQIKKYIESQELKYGILTNMRDLGVYTVEKEREIEEYNFNFLNLYRDYKQNPTICVEQENTKRFLNFVKNFSYTPLTKERKIERIAKAKPWTEKEDFTIKSLTDQLRHIVNILHRNVKELKPELISMAKAGRVSDESIAHEVEEIAAQISGREPRKVDPETFDRIMNADDATTYGKARDAFFRRVAYFAMTRLLLARVWEDIGFVDQSLYDGGFAKWYENFNCEIRKVLRYAFDLSAERYPWLFNVNNNYSWYEPSDDALIDSLYELSNFYLGKLDQDVLGTIYEDYIEKVDKKNKGQYYTPREIVSFIWDRVGFNNPKAFFWHIEGKRVPKFILDPATGSGGFLVEAARRIRECPDFDWNDPQDLQDIHQAILWYIFGSEISPFPYYLTQVNLLIQLTPVIKRIISLTEKKPREQPTPLGILCKDSLELHNPDPERLSLELEEKKEKDRHEILHFTLAEKKIYEKIKDKFAGKFAYCCSNPPYVGEKGHKELFQHTLKSYPYWSKYYQGKMDYLYWFIILGLSKLREYGKLGFITSAYWPTADGASKLRKYIMENAKINEIVFFEEVKIFEHAKGQHNMIFILTKCSGEDKKEERENNRIKIVQVKCKNQDLPGDTIRENLDFLSKHIQKHIDKPKYEDEYIKVLWSAAKQEVLSEGAWNLKYSVDSNAILNKIEKSGEKIGDFLRVGCGVLTNRDYVTAKNIRRLTESEIERHGIKVGCGIFVLSEEEYRNLSLLPQEKELIKPWYKNSEVSRYIPDPDEKRNFLIYLRNKDDLDKYPTIKGHLMKFKGILDYQLLGYGETNKWYAVTRASEDSVLKREKIFTPYRAERNTFAYSNTDFFSSKDLYYITYQAEEPSNIRESLKYVLGILNSSAIEFWCLHKLKHKGTVREYYATPLKNIPIHRINFDAPNEAKLHDDIVNKVKSIRERMSELAEYSKYFSNVRLTKIPFDAPLPEVNHERIIESIPPERVYNIRTHPELKIEKPKDFEQGKFYLSKVDKPQSTLTGGARLRLKGKDGTSIFVDGSHELLKLLFSIVSNWIGKPWNEIKENILLPDKIQSFNVQRDQILNDMQNIRSEIIELQKQIDQIVYKLYGLNETDAMRVNNQNSENK